MVGWLEGDGTDENADMVVVLFSLKNKSKRPA